MTTNNGVCAATLGSALASSALAALLPFSQPCAGIVNGAVVYSSNFLLANLLNTLDVLLHCACTRMDICATRSGLHSQQDYLRFART